MTNCLVPSATANMLSVGTWWGFNKIGVMWVGLMSILGLKYVLSIPEAVNVLFTWETIIDESSPFEFQKI